MVGIVVVSHSLALARAAVALAEEMLQGRRVPIVVAAGLDENTFGTDAVAIHQALLDADEDGDGVVVLMDLGSAVLSAELALDLLEDDDRRQRVLLCPAPLVEGLVVAAVTALSGAGRAEVAAEALNSLAGKQSQLIPATEADRGGPADSGDETAEVTRLVVTAEHGLHARPAAKLVRLLQEADAQVELRNLSTGSAWVPATSLSRLATLGALNGHEIEARAHGPRAREALKELSALAERNFDDPGSPAQPDLAPDRAGPLPASPGIGIGPALVLAGFDDLAGLGQVPAAGEQDERRSLDSAITAVRAQIEQVRGRVSREVGEAEAAIFDAHLALLADPEIVDGTRSRIGEGQPAAQAWAEAIRQVEAEFRALSDPYLKARAADVRAVGHQVLAELTGSTKAVDKSGYSDHVVLVAADLTPAQAATLDPDLISAVVLAFGSPTAHSAILVRARGIPAVVGAGPGLLRIDDGTPLAVDGSTGELIINPSDAELSEFRARSTAAQVRRQQAIADAATAADTEDGVRILVGANVGSVDDAHAAAASGADLIGLVRTEFLFLGRTKAPDVEEQETVYRALAEAAAGLRITLRTLDVGGDKPLDYLPMPAEANPFLGVRGIRLALQRPQLLADQLFAIIRVAHDVPVSVMFPMVSTLAELISARRMLDDAIRSVGTGPPAGLQVGIMVEVPAAALKAATFAPHVDFLSIGTNDLTQYTLAAERGNDAVALLGDPLDPGVLKLIDATCRGAGHAVVAVCGELAADERAARVLAGLGVRELSVSPRAVPGVKQAVREVRLADAEALAGRALAASSAAAVHTLLAEPSLNRH